MVKRVVQLFNNGNSREAKGMCIGELLKKRMSALNVSLRTLASEALMDEGQIKDILNNEITVDQIDLMDLELISQVLYCTSDYFINEEVRIKDVINAAMNRGESDPVSNRVKGKLQQFANDFVLLKNLL